jgi:hypothetical protein
VENSRSGGRGGFAPETEYRARRTQYWWGVIQTSGGGAEDTWGEVTEVVVRVRGGELEIGWGGASFGQPNPKRSHTGSVLIWYSNNQQGVGWGYGE